MTAKLYTSCEPCPLVPLGDLLGRDSESLITGNHAQGRGEDDFDDDLIYPSGEADCQTDHSHDEPQFAPAEAWKGFKAMW